MQHKKRKLYAEILTHPYITSSEILPSKECEYAYFN